MLKLSLIVLLVFSSLLQTEGFNKINFIRKGFKSQTQKMADDDMDSDNESRVIGQEDDSVVKLKAEIAAPFRLFRKFIYGGMAAAGGVGSITAIPQLIFALQDGGDKNAAIQNVAIDVGAVVSAIVLFKIENDKETEKIETFKEKQKKLTNKLSNDQLVEREKELSLLPVEIQISETNENSTRIVPLGDLLGKGKQNVILVAGEAKFVRDAVISAKIEGNDLFNSKETMVIPFIFDTSKQLDEDKGRGFGAKETLMSASYIAKPTQLNVWEQILGKEVKQAELEGVKDVLSQGLVLAVKQSGKVVRRGLGLPPWKQLIEEFQ